MSDSPSPQSRRPFDPPFQREAVQLSRKLGVRQVVSDLGITESNRRHWRTLGDRHGREAVLPLAERTDREAENCRLKPERETAREERDMLIKAGAFFAKEPS